MNPREEGKRGSEGGREGLKMNVALILRSGSLLEWCFDYIWKEEEEEEEELGRVSRKGSFYRLVKGCFWLHVGSWDFSTFQGFRKYGRLWCD